MAFPIEFHEIPPDGYSKEQYQAPEIAWKGTPMGKRISIIICILMMILLPGCGNRHEPKDLAVVNSIVYDVLGNGNFKVTGEFLNPSSSGSGGGDTGGGSGGGGKSPTLTAVGESDSIRGALSNLGLSVEKELFGGHNKVRFLSEKFARMELGGFFDYQMRDYTTDETPFIIVIEGDEPERIYTCMIGMSEKVGDYIDDLGRNIINGNSKAVTVTALDFIKDYYNDGKEPVAGRLRIVECESKPSGNVKSDSKKQTSEGSEQAQNYRVDLEGLSVFKGGKLVGFMDPIEARAYNFITGSAGMAYFTVKSDDKNTILELNNVKPELKVKIEGDSIGLSVKLKTNATIVEAGDSLDLTKSEVLDEIGQKAGKQIEEELKAAIQKAQKQFQSDIYGFGKVTHIKYPEKWKEISSDWNSHFSKADLDVTVNVTINRTGQIKKSFTMEN
jgi:spore germination protein KC